MDFEFTQEQDELRATVRRFLAAEAPIAYVREQYTAERGTTRAVWQGLAGLGVTGLLVPEELGGAGMGMVEMGVVLEELGRAVHPGPFLSSAVGAVSAITAAGTAEDRERELPGLASGQRVGAVGLVEEQGSGDWRRVGTKALPAGEGSWSLSGAKGPVYDGAGADVVIVSALTDHGLGLFLVEGGARTEPWSCVDGTRKPCRLVLDETPARLLGNPGQDATEAIETVVDRVLIALVTDAVGAADAALGMAVDYAKERVQFDRPIGSFQAVQHLCADMLQAVEVARAGAYYALWAADSASPVERHRAATMAKAYAGDALFGVGANLIQVLGGIGFTWEHDAHLYYKRLLTLQQAFGGTAQHLEELARLVL